MIMFLNFLKFFKKQRQTLPFSVNHLDSQLKMINDKYENINRGGCCYFAKFLRDKLEQQPDLKVSYCVIFTGNFLDILTNTNKSLFELNTYYDAHLTHVMCNINGYLIDSNGVFTSIRKTPYKGYTYGFVSESKIKEWLEETDVWNTTFDTKYLPLIENDIKNLQLV